MIGVSNQQLGECRDMIKAVKQLVTKTRIRVSDDWDRVQRELAQTSDMLCAQLNTALNDRSERRISGEDIK